MSENALILITLSRGVFLITNILLDYSFLTSKRPIWFQIMAFAGTWVTIYFSRDHLTPIIPDPFLLGYILSLLYLVPFALVFKETLHAKIFVYFMVFSLSQCNFLICLFLELLVFKHMVGVVILLGLLVELSSIPLIRRYVRPHIRNILEVIDQQNPIFTLFPIFSFVLLAFYGVQRSNLLSTFIPLVLSTILSFFSYYLIAISIDQTKRHQQLELTSRTDSLTGLYNRRHMEERIQEEYERYQRTGGEFALIIADIDLFKGINDMYGHAGGDYLLKAVSEELRNAVREYDIVARWGGDEFLLLLPMTKSEDAMGLAERISKTVEKRRYAYEKAELGVTLTLGVSIIRSGDTVASMIHKADVVMYQGKRTGRNCVLAFDSIANTENLGRS